MDSLLNDRPKLWIKAAIAVALIALADVLMFPDAEEGLNLGLLMLGFAGAAAVHPQLRRSLLGRMALTVAVVFAVLEIEHFNPLGWVLFWIALGVAVLAGGAPEGEGAWQWAQRLAVLGLKSLVGPLMDLHELARSKDARAVAVLRSLPLTLLMPLVGAVIFVWLFAVANPLIGDWFAAWHIAPPDFGRIAFWGFVGVLAWGVLRPRGLGRTLATPDARSDLVLPGVTPASVTLSLVVFNAVFALQNLLDAAFLWSGAKLPHGMTFASYAHRGAFPLIVTALLAGLFVVVLLRPGSETARRPVVRWLVVAWIVQNLFLVASTALRTLNYVEAYALTELRIAALVWMGLVAVGLGLVGWRLIAGKSTGWLINANVLAAGLVLTGCSIVDFGPTAAAWNIRHARELGGTGEPLDLCYLQGLGPEAAVELSELAARPLPTELHDRVAWTRDLAVQRLAEHQAAWRSWTWRGERRLARAVALAGPPPALRIERDARKCGGEPYAAPLTPPANPR